MKKKLGVVELTQSYKYISNYTNFNNKKNTKIIGIVKYQSVKPKPWFINTSNQSFVVRFKNY